MPDDNKKTPTSEQERTIEERVEEHLNKSHVNIENLADRQDAVAKRLEELEHLQSDLDFALGEQNALAGWAFEHDERLEELEQRVHVSPTNLAVKIEELRTLITNNYQEIQELSEQAQTQEDLCLNGRLKSIEEGLVARVNNLEKTVSILDNYVADIHVASQRPEPEPYPREPGNEPDIERLAEVARLLGEALVQGGREDYETIKIMEHKIIQALSLLERPWSEEKAEAIRAFETEFYQQRYVERLAEVGRTAFLEYDESIAVGPMSGQNPIRWEKSVRAILKAVKELGHKGERAEAVRGTIDYDVPPPSEPDPCPHKNHHYDKGTLKGKLVLKPGYYCHDCGEMFTPSEPECTYHEGPHFWCHVKDGFHELGGYFICKCGATRPPTDRTIKKDGNHQAEKGEE